MEPNIVELVVQPDSMVVPCPDGSYTRRELLLIGFPGALGQSLLMALLLLVDLLSRPRRWPIYAGSG